MSTPPAAPPRREQSNPPHTSPITSADLLAIEQSPADAARDLGTSLANADAPETSVMGGEPPHPAPGEERKAFSRWGVLRHRHFRNVWIGAFGSSVGGWMEITGVQWAMAHATLDDTWVASGRPGAPIMMGYLAIAQMAPTLLFSMLGGVAADRFDRRSLLLLTQALMMVVAAVLCVAAFMDKVTPWFLLAMGAINGVIVAFNIPAWQVLTPRLVPREELTQAITLNGMQFNLARALGPALGGLVMAQWGGAWLFAINAVSFLGVMLAVASTPKAPAPSGKRGRALAEILEAGSYLRNHRGAFALVLGITVFSMLGTPILRMLPIMVSEVYHKEEAAFGFMLAMMGLGAVVGGLLMRRIPAWYPKHHFVPLSITLAGLSIAVLASLPDYWLAMPTMFVCGIFWMWAFSAAFAALQLLVDDSIRGRVLALCNMLSFGLMPVGSLLAGVIGEFVAQRTNDGPGTQVGVGVLAVILAIFGFCALIWRTPEIDGLRPGDRGYDRSPGLLRGITASAHRPGPAQG